MRLYIGRGARGDQVSPREGRAGITGRHRRHPLRDPLENPVRRFGISLVQRELERQGVGTAVALYHYTLETDQRRTVVAAGIHPWLERPQRRVGHRSREPACPIAREFSFEGLV